MNNTILLKDLICEVKMAIEPWEYSKSTLWQYNYCWVRLQKFHDEKKESYFNEKTANEFINIWKKKYEEKECKQWKYSLMRHTTQLITMYWKHGHVEWFKIGNCKFNLFQSDLIKIFNDYNVFIKNDGKSDSTCLYYCNFTRYFLEFIEKRKKELGSIDQQDVVDFIVYINSRFKSTSIRTVLAALRSFFKFLEQEGMITSAVLLAVPASGIRKTSIIKPLTKNEENKIIASFNTDRPIEKRNKAIILTAMRLGLRMSDILNLTFENIDWKANTISIVVHKTLTPLQLPLLNDVGNAIADYIINGRPISSCRQIFIKHTAPYSKLKEAHYISSKLFNISGINQNIGDKKGLHVYRHSLASKLLSHGTSLPGISSILGHVDQQSSQIYIATDVNGMKQCPLTLEGIEIVKKGWHDVKI